MKPVGQAVWETQQAESSARAVLPEEIRVKDAWGKGKKIERKKKKEEGKKRKKKQRKLPFSQERFALCLVQEALESYWIQSKAQKSKDTVGKGRFIFVLSYFYCLT